MVDNNLPAPGQSIRVVYPSSAQLPLTIYRPKTLDDPHNVIVAVHGISRQYKAQLQVYSELADKFGCWLIVPEFEKNAFPQYQQLCKGRKHPRADLDLNIALIAFRKHAGLPRFKLKLCGYSGGAQFAHRYALFHPALVHSAVICSAGWYTFPDETTAYPYGIKSIPKWMGSPQLKSFLSLPMLVTVGELDTLQDDSLRQSHLLTSQQGLHRLERAVKWANCIKQLSESGDAVGRTVHFHSLPNLGHCFLDSFKTKELKKIIEKFWQNVVEDDYEY